MDVNLESDIDTIILHIGVNDILQNSTPDNVINHIKNVLLMLKIWRDFGVNRVLLSGIVYTKRISLNILEDIHNQLVNLSRNLDIYHIGNRNICGLHLFKDDLHLLESGKKIFANNIIFYLNNYYYTHTNTLYQFNR